MDPLEPVDAFNISVPWQKPLGLKADKCRLRLLLWKSEASVARSIITLYSPTTPWTSALPRPDANLGRARSILGHHYQRDEVIRFADFRGDSYKLAQEAARTSARIHRFLRRAFHGRKRGRAGASGPDQVILPDLNAGCSMADMAEIAQVEDLLGATGCARPDRRRGRGHYAASPT